MTESMVERVARAILRDKIAVSVRVLCEHGAVMEDASIPPAIEATLDKAPEVIPAMWGVAKMQARAAIAALREPTPEMARAGMDVLWKEVKLGYCDSISMSDQLAAQVLEAMANVALKD